MILSVRSITIGASSCLFSLNFQDLSINHFQTM